MGRTAVDIAKSPDGNVLDFWAALHRLPLFDTALHLAETFQLLRSRKESR